MTDKVRVLRVIEYVGDREWVESQVTNSIHGTRVVRGRDGRGGEIRAATIGEFPDILTPDGEFGDSIDEEVAT